MRLRMLCDKKCEKWAGHVSPLCARALPRARRGLFKFEFFSHPHSSCGTAVGYLAIRIMSSLKGKVFFLDLPGEKSLRDLQRGIEKRGGIVGNFFNKKVRYLVTSRRQASKFEAKASLPCTTRGARMLELLASCMHCN